MRFLKSLTFDVSKNLGHSLICDIIPRSEFFKLDNFDLLYLIKASYE